jgi:hypothetical protein
VTNITEQTTSTPEEGAENNPGSRRGGFVKGISGNPGGRPKVEGEIRNLARKYSRTAIRRLAQLVKSKNERVAVAAATALLDRAWGRPAQALTGADGAPLIPPGLLGAGPISDAQTASQVYLAFMGNPTINLDGIRFDASAALPEPQAPEEPAAQPIAPVPVPTVAALPVRPVAVHSRVQPVPVDHSTWERLSE